MRGLLMSAPNRLAVWCSLLVAAAGTASGRAAAPYAPARQSSGEFLVEAEVSGQPGGRLIVALRSEPKTLNPVIAADGPSREVIGLMTADLIHINRASHESEPALARSWDVSADGRQYTIHLRRGIRFSDGMPFDADDVIFTFQVLLDERSRAPQRDLLVIAGKPLEATKLDAHTVRFTLAEPYAAAERLFDSIAMLPQHQLQSAYEKGQLPQAWTLASTPSDVAGLGPFRLKQYVAGERLVLERNPHYWKVDRRASWYSAWRPMRTRRFFASRQGKVTSSTASARKILLCCGAINNRSRFSSTTWDQVSNTTLCCSIRTISPPRTFRQSWSASAGSRRNASARPCRSPSIARRLSGSPIRVAQRHSGAT
jgi:ABC-type transport system substrate-binding protein